MVAPAKYRYTTEAWFPDMETLERAFLGDEAQAKLAVDVQRLADPVFLISDEAVATGGLG